MVQLKLFFLKLYEFLAYPFNVLGYRISFLEITYLTMIFTASLNFISRLFGKVEETDDGGE